VQLPLSVTTGGTNPLFTLCAATFTVERFMCGNERTIIVAIAVEHYIVAYVKL
jgi:hypothetical protein